MITQDYTVYEIDLFSESNDCKLNIRMKILINSISSHAKPIILWKKQLKLSMNDYNVKYTNKKPDDLIVLNGKDNIKIVLHIISTNNGQENICT